MQQRTVFCKNEFEFTLAKYNIYNKWHTMGLTDFKNYFDEQWVKNEKFNKCVTILILIVKHIYK